MTGGLRINYIPREGGNTFKGSFFAHRRELVVSGKQLHRRPEGRGLTAPNSLKRAYDINPAGGGPIMRDKLWFYSLGALAGQRDLHRRALRQPQRGRPDRVDLCAGPEPAGLFSTRHAAERQPRLTWQATPRNKFSVYYEKQGAIGTTLAPARRPSRRTH